MQNKPSLSGFGFSGGSDSKESCQQCQRPGFNPSVGKIPWRREWLHTSVFLPGEFHGQRSLVSYSPWGHKQSDTTKQLHTHTKLMGTGQHTNIIRNLEEIDSNTQG